MDSACPCGKKVRKGIRYCGPEHRLKYGKRRQKDPNRWMTFNCLSCGEETTRRKTYSQNKYCSNSCAMKHTRTKKHIQVEDGSILDSKSEAFFWGLCGLHKIPVERFDREEGVEWKPGVWYAPDFLIAHGGEEIAVEIKGYIDPEDHLRWKAYREQKGALWVLTDDDLRKMNGFDMSAGDMGD